MALNGMGSVYPQVITENPGTMGSSFGIVSADIATGTFGLVTALGFMFGMNTSAWTEGALLYSDSSGQLTTTAGVGLPVATVVSKDAVNGVLYVFPITGQVAPGDVGWQTVGNDAGPSDVIGTLNAQDFRMVTAGSQKAVLTQNGQFGIGEASPTHTIEVKSHTSANASGIQEDTWYVETNATGFQPAIAVTLSDPSIVRIEFTANARESAGTGFASFRRSGLFFRQSSSVQIQGLGWQSDFTQVSNSAFNVQYILGLTDVQFNVHAMDATNHHWSGTIRIQQIF